MPAATIAMTPSGIGLVSQLSTRPAGLEAAPAAKPEALSNPGSRPTRPPTERRLLIEGLSGSSKVPSFWRQSRNGVGRLCAPLGDGLDEPGVRHPKKVSGTRAASCQTLCSPSANKAPSRRTGRRLPRFGRGLPARRSVGEGARRSGRAKARTCLLYNSDAADE